MDVRITYQDGVRFQAESRGHRILSDQPLDNHGQDGGMTPPEWFLASLGACVGFYAVKYLEARHLDPSGLNVVVTADKVNNPTRLDNIRIQVKTGILLDEHHQKGLEKAVDACIIHNTLTYPPNLITEIQVPAPV
ncbi:OsmC family protein [Synechococcus sp. Nb3U1]|uniref:OsmC family protein n=1 Tax=Synechococcus sp. Nb3U1 TaxID=1914529 RepID=UPI001F42DD53|nr:OsmC family protein [Synechococcus sp. Nb3U1]MCF2970670.1 OsmC family protein [Synechococcus sp. Nb3U1]